MKFIRINPKLKTMKAGGGSPNLEAPPNIKSIKRLQNELEKIEFFMSEEVAYLTHKPIAHNDFIPAASRRFINALKFLLSNNKKWYETTFFDEDEKCLVFVYWISFVEIIDMKNKIEKTLDFLTANLKSNIQQTLQSLFDDTQKEMWKSLINAYKIKHSLSIFSITSLREFIFKTWKSYGSFVIPKKNINLDGKNQENMVFASSNSKNKARDILISNRVQILFEDDVSLDVKGFFKGKLPGLISLKSIQNIKPLLKTYDDNTTKKVLYKIVNQEDTHQINVGVIDGGISSNSIIFRDLSSYHSNEMMFKETNPTGNHAENVASVLLFAKNIAKINDNLPRPLVHLFDVIADDDDIISIKNKIKKILQLYAHKIKIWNFSIVFPDLKNSITISGLGVFLDKLQKQYKVIFVVPTGNRDEKSISKFIEAPSGSCLALSVGATTSDFKTTSYSKKGYKKYVTAKPDLVTFGGDKNDPFPVISNNEIIGSMGTSFAVPLVVRKLSFLIAKGLKINEAVALLINYAHYFMFKKKIVSSEFNGHGVLPVDASELLDFKNNKAIVIMNLNLKTDYKQGILDIQIPKTNTNKFDFSYFISINTYAIFEQNETFEYVLDAPRIVFGKVYNDNVLTWKADDRKLDKEDDMDLGEEALESNLRTYKGKYKNRDTLKKELSRSIASTFKVKGEEYNIERWGIKITRNSLRPEGRQEKIRAAITIIFESRSINSFINQFIQQNHTIIKNVNGVEFKQEVIDEIKFI